MSLLPGMPNPNQEDVAWRRFLGWSLSGLAAAAAVVAIAVGHVPDPVPGWALGHEVVYRVEVFVVLFALVYAVLAAIAFAFHGRVFASLPTPAGQIGDPQKLDPSQTDGLDATKEGVGHALDALAQTTDTVQRALSMLAAKCDVDLREELEELQAVVEAHSSDTETPDANGDIKQDE